MGQSLYPRVPDFRATATQELTDGEIHLHYRKWRGANRDACLGQSTSGAERR
jgi:hypothetical protein